MKKSSSHFFLIFFLRTKIVPCISSTTKLREAGRVFTKIFEGTGRGYNEFLFLTDLIYIGVYATFLISEAYFFYKKYIETY